MMNNWHNKKVKDLCFLGRGRVISQTEINNNPGIYPVYSSQSFNNGEMGQIGTYDFNSDLVTWTTDGAYAGTVFFRTGKFNCTNVCGTLKAKNPDEIDLKFLAYLLSTKSKKHVSYVGNPKLMNGVMAEISFNLPKEKNEQSKIATILSTIDKSIEQTESLIAKYTRIKTGLMQDLLTKGIDKNGNIRNEKTHKFVVKNGIKVPEEWEVEPLGINAFVTKLAGFEYTLHFDYSIGGEIICVRALNLKNGELELTDIHTMPRTTSDFLLRSKLYYGDLVMSYVGTVGEMAVIDEDNKYHLAPNVAKISVKRSKINPWFLKEYLFSYIGKKEIENQTASTTQAAMSMSNLRKLKIILPLKHEQDNIIEKLKSISDNITSEINILKKLQLIKHGLMTDLLSGKVKVKI